jgi:hypothetical protein
VAWVPAALLVGAVSALLLPLAVEAWGVVPSLAIWIAITLTARASHMSALSRPPPGGV